MVSEAEFTRLVEAAIEKIPAELRQALDNLAIVVEEWPDDKLMQEVTGDPDTILYGFFDGVPLPERRLEDSGDLPAIIYIYKGPLEEDFPHPNALCREVEITLVHEIAHFMGLDEDQIRAYGYD